MAETGASGQADISRGLRIMARGLILASGLFLAACQTIVPKGAGPDQPAPPPPPQVTPGLPQDNERHRIALLVPTTGPNAGVGQSLANATTLALLDTEAKNIRITTYDTGKGVAAAASKAISDGNKLILGPLTADEVKATAQAAQPARVPVISFSNDSSVAGNGVYLLGYSPAQSVERVVSYAQSKGMKNFAALVPAGTYGERTGNALLRAVEAAGGVVVAMQTYQRSAGSITAAIRKLPQPATYDAVLIADGGRIALQAAPLIRQNGGANARLLGTELWNTEESTVAPATALRGAWFASVQDQYYRQLATKYRARFKSAPYRLSALGYDAVLLTVRIAQDWKVGTAFPVARLNDKGGFVGIDGAFRFGRDGIAERALEVQQVDAGRYSVIDAAPRGF